MKRITIDPVTRIEGHAKDYHPSGRRWQGGAHPVPRDADPRVRKVHRRPPVLRNAGITSRVCGICPISHLLASSKACDAILAVRIPKAAALLRELVHYAQFVQSHALSFFHLSSPDLLLGFDSDIAKRNVIGAEWRR